ncbi:hypothetical protein DL93DRAFT_2055303, partial [Clavulina sp. PMI_390]
AELETQAAALKAYDEQDFEKALQIYETIADTSKIHTNIGLILATLGEHEAAVDSFNAATELDKYLAVAYFQCGVSNFLLGRFEYALKDFEEALQYLRGNQNINYEQLGLKFKLHAAEVYFNRGLCYLYLGDEAAGMQDMTEARNNKAVPEHDVIDDAIRDRGEEYTVFSIPVGILFRPSETKLRNAKTKDYMGKAKLISAADARDEFTAFTGVTRLRQDQLPSGAPLDRSGSFSARSAQAAADKDKSGSLMRSATAAARVENASKPLPAPAAASLPERSRTIAAPGGGPGAGGPGMTRGLSLPAGLTRQMTQLNVRDRNEPAPPPAAAPQQSRGPPPSASNNGGGGGGGSRLTEIYNDYLGDEEPAPALPPNATDRVAQWASKTTPGAPPSNSTSPPPTMSSNDRLRQNVGVPLRRSETDASMRRKPSRRRLNGSVSGSNSRAPSSYAQTNYDDDYVDEEGYVSGEYDDMENAMTKLRVKIHCDNEIRGMTLLPSVSFDEFVDKVSAKFGQSANSLNIKFKDEDGNKVSLVDDSDFDLAMEVARDSAKSGKRSEGKLEVWCSTR